MIDPIQIVKGKQTKTSAPLRVLISYVHIPGILQNHLPYCLIHVKVKYLNIIDIEFAHTLVNAIDTLPCGMDFIFHALITGSP